MAYCGGMHDMNASAVILAGGESRRMGFDKAWMKLDGKPLLELAVAKVRELGIEAAFISGRAGVDYSVFHCPILIDLEPGFGPLGGIEKGDFRRPLRPGCWSWPWTCHT
jgi:molybdopterin-guanine dinucleotide biosynthesis protein A